MANHEATWPIDRSTAVKTALGFAVAMLLLYLLGAVIGWTAVIEGLRQAEPTWMILAGLSSLLCLLAWGGVWWIVLGAAEITTRVSKLMVAFFAGTFANYVTPMGQVGGEPVIAYILAHDVDIRYETSLASIVTADVLRLLPFFNIGLLGLGFILLDGRLTDRTEGIAAALVMLAVGIPVTILLLWRFRRRAQSGLLRVLSPIAAHVDRVNLDGVSARLERLIDTTERIAAARRALVLALILTYVGWILFAAPLYFAGLAIGVHLSPLVVAFVVPATVIAGSTPTPGGLAVIEGTVVVLLVALTPTAAGDAFVIALLYRVASYWLVILIGAGAFLWVLKRA